MRSLSLLLSCVLLSIGARADHWPQWRGPAFNGSAPDADVPLTWSRESGLAWTTPLPGPGGATPAVWDESVFVTSPDAEKNLHLYCLDRATGAVRWKQKLASGDFTRGNNNLAAPSPVTDGRAVYALFGTGNLAALDFTGKTLWQRDLAAEFGKFSVMWLYGSSPLLYRGRLYVQVLQRSPVTYEYAKDGKPERESFLLCLDPADGHTIWRHVRTTDAQEESMESYATPMPYEGPEGSSLLAIGGDWVSAHDVATGAERWRASGLNPKRDHWRRVVPSPASWSNLVFACGPKREPILAIRAGGTGDVTATHTAWTCTNFSPDVCTPLVYRDRLYIHDGDRKVMQCFDPATGTQIWQGAMPVEGVTRASPVAAAGRIYTISEAGLVVVLEAGPAFKVLSTVAMGEGPCRATIAVSDGQLFIRTAKSISCVGQRTKR
jgi:outer membrane protein assembly factor BamB